mgnify:CR=1 FL=1
MERSEVQLTTREEVLKYCLSFSETYFTYCIIAKVFVNAFYDFTIGEDGEKISGSFNIPIVIE